MKSTRTTLHRVAQSGDGLAVRSTSSSLSKTGMCAKSQHLRLNLRMVRLGASISTSPTDRGSILPGGFAGKFALSRKGMAQSLLLGKASMSGCAGAICITSTQIESNWIVDHEAGGRIALRLFEAELLSILPCFWVRRTG
ncbi:hypothetical protein [Methylosinus sporium]|uniref:hypothetical protein n=1 Tax=Methylosinus sporium TaxID=428 RepID=UPI00383ACDE1